VVGGANAARLGEGLRRMALWRRTQSVSLLLAADAQRTNHPSNTLEARRQPLQDLLAGEAATDALRLEAATLLRWC